MLQPHEERVIKYYEEILKCKVKVIPTGISKTCDLEISYGDFIFFSESKYICTDINSNLTNENVNRALKRDIKKACKQLKTVNPGHLCIPNVLTWTYKDCRIEGQQFRQEFDRLLNSPDIQKYSDVLDLVVWIYPWGPPEIHHMSKNTNKYWVDKFNLIFREGDKNFDWPH